MPRLNKKATAKQNSHGKIKKPHSRIKNSRQNKNAAAKQKFCGKTKKPRQNKKATAKLKEP